MAMKMGSVAVLVLVLMAIIVMANISVASAQAGPCFKFLCVNDGGCTGYADSPKCCNIGDCGSGIGFCAATC